MSGLPVETAGAEPSAVAAAAGPHARITGQGAVEGTNRPAASRRPVRADTRSAVALAGPLLFSPLALTLAAREATLLGLPPLLAYVFAVWLVGIALTYLLARR